MKTGFPPFPFAQSGSPFADRTAWKWQYKMCRAQQKAARKAARAEARAERWPSPLSSLLHLVWLLFWIGFFVWLFTGGHEARLLVWSALQTLASTVRDLFVSFVGAVQ